MVEEHVPVSVPATFSHSIVKFAVPAVLSFVGLNALGQNTSPFETHPKTVRFSIMCLLLYCLSYGAQLRFSTSAFHDQPPPMYANAYGRCMEWFGSMLLASLASICFPDSVQWLFFVLYAIFCMAAPLYTLFQKLWKRWIPSAPTRTPTPTVAADHVDHEAGQPP